MLNNISYFEILGLPVLVWLGILTLICLLFTAAISVMNKKGINKIPFEWHPRMAKITIVLAFLHAALAVLAYF